jgi:hypothetical protein
MFVGFQCLTCLWNSSVLHVCGIPVSYIFVEFQCFTYLWDSSVLHVCGAPVSKMFAEFQCQVSRGKQRGNQNVQRVIRIYQEAIRRYEKEIQKIPKG